METDGLTWHGVCTSSANPPAPVIFPGGSWRVRNSSLMNLKPSPASLFSFPTAVLRLSAAALLAGLALTAQALSVGIYVDAAPNVNGSPLYAGWWANAKAEASAGTFVNMANSANPGNSGTTNFDIEDVSVYSFGDLGTRLHFVYWIPETDVATLRAQNLQISLDYDWDSLNYVGIAPTAPTTLTDYNGGVIGTAGWAWWAAYGINTQAAVDSDIDSWRPYQGDINFHVLVGGQEIGSLTAQHNVPDAGSTAFGLVTALLGLGVFRRFLRRG